MKKQLNIPKFANEDEEFEFFSSLDLSEYFEPSDFKPASFPNLQPTSQKISLRIPSYMVSRLKERAHAIGLPYQSLIKKYLAEKLDE